MSLPTHAEAEACFEALHDGPSAHDVTDRWISELDAADVSDPLVVSALQLLRATSLNARISGPGDAPMS